METCALHLAKLKPAISPNVGGSDAQFLVVGDCVRASPVQNIQAQKKMVHWKVESLGGFSSAGKGGQHHVIDNMLSQQYFPVASRPGPNIPLILPIIQELYSLISTPLFKRKLPIILKKTSCKRNDTV